MTTTQGEDIVLWADGTWCLREDLAGMGHMSDDYEIVPFDTVRWHEIHGD